MSFLAGLFVRDGTALEPGNGKGTFVGVTVLGGVLVLGGLAVLDGGLVAGLGALGAAAAVAALAGAFFWKLSISVRLPANFMRP